MPTGRNSRGTRAALPALLRGSSLEMATDCPEHVLLRRYLLEHKDELLDMLMRWDEDGDGCINPKEFSQGCRVLQLDAGLKMKIPREVFDALFNELDVNATGNIAFEDLELALQSMPVPEEPPALDTVDEEQTAQNDDDVAQDGGELFVAETPRQEEQDAMPKTDAEPDTELELDPADHKDWIRTSMRRVRRRSKSLPNSPTTSPVQTRAPSPAASCRSVPPRRLPQLSPRDTARQLCSNKSIPIGRRAGFVRSPNAQPPRRTNLPRINGARSVSDDARSTSSFASTMSIAGMSPRERMEHRMRREQELNRQHERRSFPGFNVPGPGQYVPYDKGTGTIECRVEKAKATPSPWAMDTSRRMLGGNSLDVKHKTHVGDPGTYVTHMHEMAVAQERAGNAALSFWSTIPQRPPPKKF